MCRCDVACLSSYVPSTRPPSWSERAYQYDNTNDDCGGFRRTRYGQLPGACNCCAVLVERSGIVCRIFRKAVFFPTLASIIPLYVFIVMRTCCCDTCNTHNSGVPQECLTSASTGFTINIDGLSTMLSIVQFHVFIVMSYVNMLL